MKEEGSPTCCRHRNATLDWDGINAERRQNLKQARGCAKRSLTIVMNKVGESLLVGNSVEEVNSLKGSLDEAFENFRQSCDLYCEALEIEDDIDESKAYFHEAEVKYLCIKERIALQLESFIHPVQQTHSEENLEENREWRLSPSDSVSQTKSKKSLFSRCSRSSKGTRSSSLFDERKLKNATWKASLLAEASMLQQKQLLANQELQVNQIKEELRLRTELAKIEAMEKVCDEFSSSKMTPHFRVTHDGHDFSQADTLQTRPPLFTESSASQQFPPAIHAPAQLPVASHAPAQLLVASHAPAQLPDASHAPAQLPFASHAPAQLPFASHAPAQLLVASHAPAQLPDASHAPAQLPDASHAPAQLPFASHAPAQLPDASHAPAQLPFASHAPAQLPDASHAPAQLPDASHAPAQLLDASHAPAQLPFASHAPAQLLVASHAPAQLPVAKHAPAQLPFASHVPPQLPFDTDVFPHFATARYALQQYPSSHIPPQLPITRYASSYVPFDVRPSCALQDSLNEGDFNEDMISQFNIASNLPNASFPHCPSNVDQQSPLQHFRPTPYRAQIMETNSRSESGREYLDVMKNLAVCCIAVAKI